MPGNKEIKSLLFLLVLTKELGSGCRWPGSSPPRWETTAGGATRHQLLRCTSSVLVRLVTPLLFPQQYHILKSARAV